MKKLASYLLVVLFVGMLASCGGSGDAKKDIVGTWKLESMDLGQEIPAEQKAMFDAMMETMKKDFVMTFKDDGTYETKKDADGTPETGKYKVDGKTLITTKDSGKEDKITIVSISSSKMVLEIPDGDKKMKMTLVK